MNYMRIVNAIINRTPLLNRYIKNRSQDRYIKDIKVNNRFDETVLFINHNFTQDIECMSEYFKDYYNVLVIDNIPFFNDAYYIFKKKDERIGEVSYKNISEIKKEKYRMIVSKKLDYLMEITNLKFIIMPSDSFWWIREFVTEARERGLITIVVDKEGTISPLSYEVHANFIKEKFPFISDYLFVWSERQKKFWNKTGVNNDKIFVVGQPRSDFFKNEKKWLTKKELEIGEYKTILFFTFEIDAYIHILEKNNNNSWKKLRNNIREELFKFIEEHDDVQLIVKCHPQQNDLWDLRDFYKKINNSRIKLIEGAKLSNQLIVNSDLIIGFQTTALIESLSTKKEVFYTAWTEEFELLKKHLIPFHDYEGFQVISSKKEFSQKLSHWYNDELMTDFSKRKKIVSDYLYVVDGNVSKRICEKIGEL